MEHGEHCYERMTVAEQQQVYRDLMPIVIRELEPVIMRLSDLIEEMQPDWCKRCSRILPMKYAMFTLATTFLRANYATAEEARVIAMGMDEWVSARAGEIVRRKATGENN